MNTFGATDHPESLKPFESRCTRFTLVNYHLRIITLVTKIRSLNTPNADLGSHCFYISCCTSGNWYLENARSSQDWLHPNLMLRWDFTPHYPPLFLWSHFLRKSALDMSCHIQARSLLRRAGGRETHALERHFPCVCVRDTGSPFLGYLLSTWKWRLEPAQQGVSSCQAPSCAAFRRLCTVKQGKITDQAGLL